MYELIQLPLLAVITTLMSYREPVQSLFLLPEISLRWFLLLYGTVKHPGLFLPATPLLL